MSKYYVFKEWRDYDDGGMNAFEFETSDDLKAHLQEQAKGEDPDKIKELLESITIIYGDKRVPDIEEVVLTAKFII